MKENVCSYQMKTKTVLLIAVGIIAAWLISSRGRDGLKMRKLPRVTDWRPKRRGGPGRPPRFY